MKNSIRFSIYFNITYQFTTNLINDNKNGIVNKNNLEHIAL